MSTYNPIPFCPPFWLNNAHLQTLLPRLIPTRPFSYQRQLHLDSTGRACVAYDFVHNKVCKDRPLCVLFHGLEGSSQSPYAKAFANYAKQHNHALVVIHYRGCGGIKNTAQVDYHAGDTQEIHHVLTRLGALSSKLYVVGVSLGGNMLAKYLGNYGDRSPLMAAAVISAPLDLTSSSQMLKKSVAKRIYVPYLLSSLLKKAKPHLSADKRSGIATLEAFDDLYTAPRHGYTSAADYYKTASALPVLGQITCPTLIVNSQDDPFLGQGANKADLPDNVHLYTPKHGGHVGFVDRRDGKLSMAYLPTLVFDFFAWVGQ